jgi:hypothetical protein
VTCMVSMASCLGGEDILVECLATAPSNHNSSTGINVPYCAHGLTSRPTLVGCCNQAADTSFWGSLPPIPMLCLEREFSLSKEA